LPILSSFLSTVLPFLYLFLSYLCHIHPKYAITEEKLSEIRKCYVLHNLLSTRSDPM
jgi:hypothetical protein